MVGSMILLMCWLVSVIIVAGEFSLVEQGFRPKVAFHFRPAPQLHLSVYHVLDFINANAWFGEACSDKFDMPRHFPELATGLQIQVLKHAPRGKLQVLRFLAAPLQPPKLRV